MTRPAAPWIVFAVFAAAVTASSLREPPAAGGFDLQAFRQLPVSINGRVQPIDSVAKVALLRISGRDRMPRGTGGPSGAPAAIDANEWLLEVLARPDAADGRSIFPVTDPDLAARLSLPTTGGTRLHAFESLAAKVGEIGRQVQRISRLTADRPSPVGARDADPAGEARRLRAAEEQRAAQQRPSARGARPFG